MLPVFSSEYHEVQEVNGVTRDTSVLTDDDDTTCMPAVWIYDEPVANFITKFPSPVLGAISTTFIASIKGTGLTCGGIKFYTQTQNNPESYTTCPSTAATSGCSYTCSCGNDVCSVVYMSVPLDQDVNLCTVALNEE